jgi:hypothetical protein
VKIKPPIDYLISMTLNLKKEITKIIAEELKTLKSLYGNNFQHTISQYITEDGLAEYGVHYSENNNIAIWPQSQYYPKGVYFYYLSKNCTSGWGGGFATDRPWANIVKINNDKMVIIKSDHPRNFSDEDLQRCLLLLKKKYGDIENKDQERTRVAGRFETPFLPLFRIIAAYSNKHKILFNKILHDLGYDGIIDYEGLILPVESCQGVMTWPGSIVLVQSIPTNKKRARNDFDRMQKIIQGFKQWKNGTLQLEKPQILKLFSSKPNFYHKWDAGDSDMDLTSSLLSKLDFSYKDAWEWAKNIESLHYFFDDLDANPTTPKEFWEKNLYASDPTLKTIAREKLNNSR